MLSSNFGMEETYNGYLLIFLKEILKKRPKFYWLFKASSKWYSMGVRDERGKLLMQLKLCPCYLSSYLPYFLFSFSLSLLPYSIPPLELTLDKTNPQKSWWLTIRRVTFPKDLHTLKGTICNPHQQPEMYLSFFYAHVIIKKYISSRAYIHIFTNT